MEHEYPLPIAGVLVVNPEKRILLVKFPGDEKYHVPGGKIQWGETIEQAAKREVKEEVGLDVKFDRLLFVQEALFPKDIGGRTKHYLFLECICKSRTSDVKLDGREIAGHIWISSKDALALNLDSYTRLFIEKFLKDM